MDVYIILAVVLAIIIRIVIMPGYFVLPQKVDGKWQLNTIGTIIIAMVAVVFAYNADPTVFATPIAAFVLTYATPYAIDAVSSKFQQTDTDPGTGGQ